MIYSGQGQLRAILRSVHSALLDSRAYPRVALGASILAAKDGDLVAAQALFRAVAGDDDGPMADNIRRIDALIRLYCDEPMQSAALEALAELGRRTSPQDPIGTALTSNLLAYFTLQPGDYILAKRYATRAIAQFRQANAAFGEAHSMPTLARLNSRSAIAPQPPRPIARCVTCVAPPWAPTAIWRRSLVFWRQKQAIGRRTGARARTAGWVFVPYRAGRWLVRRLRRSVCDRGAVRRRRSRPRCSLRSLGAWAADRAQSGHAPAGTPAGGRSDTDGDAGRRCRARRG